MQTDYFVKYQLKYAWGDTGITYKKVPSYYNPKKDKKEFQYLIERINDNYSWSDKFRGVYYKILTKSQLPKKVYLLFYNKNGKFRNNGLTEYEDWKNKKL